MAGINEGLLRRVLKKQHAEVFVETGTRLGETAFLASRLFDWVYTIELSEPLHFEAKERWASVVTMRFFLGDSAKVLPELCDLIRRPAVFFLDAHWYSDGTGLAIADGNPFPLWKELESIAARNLPDIVIVDDVHAFGRIDPSVQEWSEVDTESICQHLGGRVRQHEYISDVFVAYLKDSGDAKSTV